MKVSRGEYLVFGDQHSYTCEFGNFPKQTLPIIKLNDHSKLFAYRCKNKIFSSIGEIEDQHFYSNLFKYYPIYFKQDLNEKIKILVENLIENNCIGGLVVLINEYKLQIKEYHLLLSFKFNSFSVAEYIYQNYVCIGKSKKIKINPIEFWSLIKKDIKPTTAANKSIFHYIEFQIVNPKIQFLYNVAKIKQWNEPKCSNLIYIFKNNDIWNCSLMDLINSSISVIYSSNALSGFYKHRTLFFQNNRPNKHISFDSNISISIEEIYEIKNKFNQQQLKTTLEQINSTFPYYQLILKLILVIFPFININVGYFSGFYFYKLFTNRETTLSGIDGALLPFFSSEELTISLFKYCKSTEIKLGYLEILLEYIDTKPRYEGHTQTLMNLFHLFINQDDLNCLQFIYKSFLPLETYIHYFKSSQLILENVKSIQVFDFLQTHFEQVITKQLHFTKCNPNLLKIIKVHYPDQYKSFLFGNRNIYYDIQSFPDIEKVHYLYDNISTFKETDLFIQYIPPCNQLDYFENPIKIPFNEFNYFIISRFFHLNVYKQTTMVPLNKKIYIKSAERLLLYFYYSSNYQSLFNCTSGGDVDDKTIQPLYFFKNCKLLFSKIGISGDIDGLSKILLNYYSDHSIHKQISSKYIKRLNILYVYASFSGQLQIFTFIKSDYPSLYINNINNPNLLSTCIKLSNLNQHLQIEQLLNKIK